MSEANNNATNCQQKARAVDMWTTNRQSVLHSGLCSLHSPDPPPNDYRPPECRSQAAECRRGSARGNDLSVNYVTNISCVTTSHQSPAQTAVDLGYTSYFMFEPIPLTVKALCKLPNKYILTCFLSWYSRVIHHCDVSADTATDVITHLSIFFSATCCRVVEASA